MFNWLKKRRNKEVAPLVKVAQLLTDNNQAAVQSIALLVTDPKQFEIENAEWLGNIGFDVNELPNLIAAYWLTGYQTPFDFGGYIDWKEETEEILYSLEGSIKNKKYDVDLESIAFSDDDFSDMVLLKINSYLKKKDFMLVNWNTKSDSYHLFIIKSKDYAELVQCGKEINVRFHSFLKGIDKTGNVVVLEA